MPRARTCWLVEIRWLARSWMMDRYPVRPTAPELPCPATERGPGTGDNDPIQAHAQGSRLLSAHTERI